MHLPDLEQAYFLQSLGLSIGHSCWQAGILWLFYQFIIITDRKLPAFIKYNISIAFVFTSFAWFAVTLFQTYLLLLNNQTPFKLYYFEGRIFNFQFIERVLPYLSITYLLVICFYILSFYKNLSYNRFLLNSGLKKAPIDVRLFTDKFAFQMGINKKIQVWISEQVHVPSVTGFIKPIILLPAAIANQLSIQQTEAILLHELAHIKRNDYLVNMIQSVVKLVLFFNPFVILLGETAKRERENCCDDCVMTFQYDRFEYAKALICLEEKRQLLKENFAMTATNGKKNLLQRVKRMFSIQPSNSLNILQKVKLVISGAMLFLIIFTTFLISVKKNTIEESKNMSKVIAIIPSFVGKTKTGNSYKFELTSRLVIPLSKNSSSGISKKRTTKPRVPEPENEYLDAFINEDLLTPVETVDAIPSQVAEKEIPNSKYIVTIEEQQSGKKQHTIYYFELKNREGKTVIKPLIIINKTSNRAKIRLLKTSKDNLNDTSSKEFKRKRITS